MKLYNFTDEQLEGFANEVYSEVIASLETSGFIDREQVDELACNYTVSIIKKNNILRGLQKRLFPKNDTEVNDREFAITLSKVIVNEISEKKNDK